MIYLFSRCCGGLFHKHMIILKLFYFPLYVMTYKAVGRSIANYGAPVWGTNASESNIGKISYLDTLLVS